MSSGDVIAFLDSDDYWRKDKLRLQLERANASGNIRDFCVTCGHSLIGNDLPAFRPPETIGLEDILVHNIVGPTSNIMMSRSILDAVGLFDPVMPSCQDWELFIRIAQRVPILGVGEVLTFQDTDSSARISDNHKKVRDGHRAMYRRARATTDFRALPLAQRWQVRARQELALLRK
ncbi:glycosyl transferase [Sphingomonas sp. KC8]|nr:glycosyl transferase [Sphingomonas sp. KC8]